MKKNKINRILKFIYWSYAKLPKKICIILPDYYELKRLFYRYHGYFPDLDNPKTFNEKIQWYKLKYRKPLLNTLADKYLVRDYVKSMRLGHILNDLYGVYDTVEEIDLNTLPEQFVLKGTHGCAMNIICKNKAELDWNLSKKKIRRWLKTNIYYRGRSWVYKDIKPRLICEKYLENNDRKELIDFKFFCFNGKPEMVFLVSGRNSDTGLKMDVYDMEWNYIPVLKGDPPGNLRFEKTQQFAEMIQVATKLSQNIPFVRVDLYLVNKKIVFGELTFYPGNGASAFTPKHYDDYYASLFKIPIVKH